MQHGNRFRLPHEGKHYAGLKTLWKKVHLINSNSEDGTWEVRNWKHRRKKLGFSFKMVMEIWERGRKTSGEIIIAKYWDKNGEGDKRGLTPGWVRYWNISLRWTRLVIKLECCLKLKMGSRFLFSSFFLIFFFLECGSK